MTLRSFPLFRRGRGCGARRLPGPPGSAASAPRRGRRAGQARHIRRGARLVFPLATLLAWLLQAPLAAAAPAPDSPRRLAALCDLAAIRAAEAEDVPLALLRAISLAETGRRHDGDLLPWPWTVNMEGEGRWFRDPAALLDWVRDKQARGARSFDLGCFQVNHLWHGKAFESLEDMLDPDRNARYAARFLRALREETGSWEIAAGHYHSRTPELASRYRARVLALVDEDAPTRRELAALSQEAAQGALGSGPGRVESGQSWLLSSLSPLRGRATRAAEDPVADAADDAMAASLARAWLATADAPSKAGLLRAARPLLSASAGPGASPARPEPKLVISGETAGIQPARLDLSASQTERGAPAPLREGAPAAAAPDAVGPAPRRPDPPAEARPDAEMALDASEPDMPPAFPIRSEGR